jgi:hypothetical protein
MKDDSSDCIMHTFPLVCYPGFMVVTPSFMNLSITFSNWRFSSCSPTVDVGFVKLTADRFLWNQGLQDEYSVLLSHVLQCCDLFKLS